MKNISYYLIVYLGLCLHNSTYGQCMAEFGYDDSSLVIQFEDLSQYTENDNIITYLWDFGDNVTSDNPSPLHIYNTAGAYTVMLTIITEDGCQDSKSYEIYICDLYLDYDLQTGCDEDNQATLDIYILDAFSNAGPINVHLDGTLLNDEPLITINDTISLNTELFSDGQEHIISIQSIDHPECQVSEVITTTACVPPCNISNIKSKVLSTESFVAEVNAQGYNPSVLNVMAGDSISFQWLADDRSVTSKPNNNGQNWDSGLLNTGDEYLLYSYAPGIYSFTSSNSPTGLVEGSLVSTCPDSAYYEVEITFENNNQPGEYQLWIDGVPTDISNLTYSPDGLDTLEIIMPGDGMLHTYQIKDMSSPSCHLSTEIQAPICGIEPDCLMYVEAIQTTPCDQDSLVEVIISILSAGGSDAGFNLYIDDVLVDGSMQYTGTETLVSKSLFGDGAEHIITIIDIANESCTTTTTILLEDCAQSCLIINPFAGIGSNNNIVASVNNESFLPKDITISAGDKVIWQWQSDTLRSVTAFDFSFDSGVKGFGETYTSPILPVGVHRYYSEFNGMEGSITVEPNCSNGLIPIFFSFSKFGGANTGYNVFVDNVQINSSPIPYSPSGNNSGNSSVEGNGEIHTVELLDAVDETCGSIQSFDVPFCDESTCAIFIEDPIISVCNDNNTVSLHMDVLTYNTDSMFQIIIDDISIDTMSYDSTGTTSLDILLAGNGEAHTIVISDVIDTTCGDTLMISVPICDAPCSFESIDIEYIEESVGDTCFDGSTKINISTYGVHDYSSDYIIEIQSTTIDAIDTMEYVLGGYISQSYTLLADGSDINISIQNSEDEFCSIDTSFTLYSCLTDPCALELLDLQYSNCRDGGIMDMAITLDTFRISDSLGIYLDGVEIFEGTYAEFYADPTFDIAYTGEERMLTFTDINIDGCSITESFYTSFCPTECTLSTGYMLIDSCILAQDTSYTIIVAGEVLNAISDSILIEVLSSGASEYHTYDELNTGISIEIPVSDNNPTLGIFDAQDINCRQFLPIEAPNCILECSIDIEGVSISDEACLNGERIATINIFYEYETSDSIVLFIDDQEIITTSYPQDNKINTSVLGDGLLHTIIVADAENSNCADTLEVFFNECEFDCSDFAADFNYSIDTISRTVTFTDVTTGGADIWKWSIGDGTESTEANPIHTYSEIGTYTICLEVTNSIENCTDTTCKELTLVDINCSASYEYSIDALTVTFENSSESESDISTSIWTINGDTEINDIDNGIYTAEESENIELCLFIETMSGCQDEYCEVITLTNPCDIDPSFDYSINFDTLIISNTSLGEYNQITWELGNGLIFLGDDLEYTYPEDGEYELCMTVTNTLIASCTFTLCETINIMACDVNPAFVFNITQDTLNAGLLENLGEYDIAWNFGNGFGANINPIQFTYSDEGEYTVCATVSDPNQENCIETFCEDISIVISSINSQYLSEIELYPNPIKQGQLITIDNIRKLDIEVYLYTESGQKLHSRTMNYDEQISIQTDNLIPGKYLVEIRLEYESVTKTILIIE